MVESEGEEARSDGETEALGVGHAGNSMQQDDGEEKEEEYEPFDCMYAIFEHLTKVFNIYSH